MKNLSWIIHGISLLGIVILFVMYSNVKSKSKLNENEASLTESKIKNPLVDVAEIKSGAKIAYINIDTLDSQYEYIKDYSAALKNKQANIEASLSSMYSKFQQDYAEFQQSVQAGLKPEAELKKQQAILEQKQNEIASKEKSLQALSEEVAMKQNDMLKNVSAFIKRYNNGKFDFILAYTSNVSSVLYAKPELEITKEVVEGLNQEYKLKKEKN